MNRLLIHLSLAVLVRYSLAQDLVSIQFQTDPVLVQTETDIVFTVNTVSDILSISWQYPGGDTPLALWAGGAAVVNPVPQYLGRVTVTANQLRIRSAQLTDAGNYTVEVNPSATTGLATNSRSVQLRVFVAVAGVSLFVPSVAVEGRNISLSCSWSLGTETSVLWAKGGVVVSPGPRISISAGSLVINPGRREDAGEYSCTVSNPVSARTATQSLTVYYGPDTPVLTKSRLAECVGGGDAVLGQTVRLTCVSDSLPPALFSWQHEGQPVASGQPDSGVLSVQTLSANQSGRYTCQARNGITGGSSEQSTDLTIVDTCLSAGAVAGIVIGCFVALLLLILLILLLVRSCKTERRQRDSRRVQKTDTNPHLVPPDSSPHLDGVHPPLHEPNMRPNHPYGLPQEGHRNSGGTPPYRRLDLDTLPGAWSGFQHSAPQNAAPPPHHHGIDNRGFSHAASQTANALPHVQQQNPNILIQAAAPDGVQPPTIQLSLGTLPHGAEPHAVHVNLNSYPTNAHATQSLPLQANPGTVTAQHNLPDLIHTTLRMQSGPADPADLQVNGHLDAGGPALIPTRYSHHNVAQRHANTQTYQQQQTTNRGSGNGVQASGGSTGHAHRRMRPWDLVRGTPAYPNRTAERSDSTDYTTQNPMRQHRVEPEVWVQTRNEVRREVMSEARRTQSRPSASESRLQDPDRAQPEAARHTHTDPRAQDRAGQQRAATGSQGHMMEQWPITAQSHDTRALADPNHRMHAGQPGAPGAGHANQHHHGNPSHMSSNTALTQDALQMHTQRAQTFQNRNQQTQAALLKSQAQSQAQSQAVPSGGPRPPTPPQLIPLAQFHALPREHARSRSPTKNQMSRPAVNLPAGQRQTHQRSNVHTNKHHQHQHHHHHHHHHGHHANGHQH